MELPFTINEIYIVKKPVDFRKGINGLLKIINDQYDRNPCDGALYIFTSRAKDRIKCVYYDGTGSWLFYKILNSGRFDWNMEGQDLISVTPEQLGWLLQGLCIDTGSVFKKFTPAFV